MFTDGQEISHAIESQPLASKNEYKAEYNEEQVGKAPSDVAIAYPEHQHHKKMMQIADSVND